MCVHVLVNVRMKHLRSTHPKSVPLRRLGIARDGTAHSIHGLPPHHTLSLHAQTSSRFALVWQDSRARSFGGRGGARRPRGRARPPTRPWSVAVSRGITCRARWSWHFALPSIIGLCTLSMRYDIIMIGCGRAGGYGGQGRHQGCAFTTTTPRGHAEPETLPNPIATRSHTHNLARRIYHHLRRLLRWVLTVTSAARKRF